MPTMLFRIDGQKLRAKRGERSLREISKSAGNAFSDVALYKWEQGKAHPRPRNVKALIAALNCDLEDIAAPYLS